MTIRTFDAVPIGTVPGATLFQLNEQRAEEGELCYTEDYKKLEAELNELKEWREQMIDVSLKALEEARTTWDSLEAELQKYKDQFPDYVECANCGSVTHVGGVE